MTVSTGAGEPLLQHKESFLLREENQGCFTASRGPSLHSRAGPAPRQSGELLPRTPSLCCGSGSRPSRAARHAVPHTSARGPSWPRRPCPCPPHRPCPARLDPTAAAPAVLLPRLTLLAASPDNSAPAPGALARSRMLAAVLVPREAHSRGTLLSVAALALRIVTENPSLPAKTDSRNKLDFVNGT